MSMADARTPESCGRCGSLELTRLEMTLRDGTEVTFINCHSCESREWLHQTVDGEWESLPIEVVLQRSAKPQ